MLILLHFNFFFFLLLLTNVYLHGVVLNLGDFYACVRLLPTPKWHPKAYLALSCDVHEFSLLGFAGNVQSIHARFFKSPFFCIWWINCVYIWTSDKSNSDILGINNSFVVKNLAKLKTLDYICWKIFFIQNWCYPCSYFKFDNPWKWLDIIYTW